MAGLFLLYLGTQMEEKWIDDWDQAVSFVKYDDGNPLPVHLPGIISCSESIKVGLDFALRNANAETKPVLFVILCQNYHGFEGVRMNNESCNAYPGEKDVLLMESARLYVLTVQRDILFNVNHNEKLIDADSL